MAADYPLINGIVSQFQVRLDVTPPNWFDFVPADRCVWVEVCFSYLRVPVVSVEATLAGLYATVHVPEDMLGLTLERVQEELAAAVAQAVKAKNAGDPQLGG